MHPRHMIGRAAALPGDGLKANIECQQVRVTLPRSRKYVDVSNAPNQC